MGLFRSLAGAVRVRLLTADVPACLQLLDRAHLTASAVCVKDSVTLELTVSRKALPLLRKLSQQKGYTLDILGKSGLYWPLLSTCRRPVLVIGMVLFLVTACWVQGRIWFIATEGNDQVDTRYILEQAEACGLKFGTRRREIRSEQVKNELLEAIPQLQWVGVNTYGCRAVITVRERSVSENQEQTTAVSHIVAARDGVIQRCSVTRGFGTCAVGQAVREGDVLISGYTDCGLVYTAERAEGEILAQTQRKVTALTPAKCHMQSRTDRVETRFSLLIGKKRINFYKGSGISGGTCDKMYSKYVLTLPGGFALPVAWLKEDTVFCSMTDMAVRNPEQMLQHTSSGYLMTHMTDGTIVRRSEPVTETDGVFRLDGLYDCVENIGIVQEEKIGELNG